MKIIALHGAGMRAGVWDLLARTLPLEALSLPQCLSIEERAAWVESQLQSHADHSIVLLGHSMGALVALAAARHAAVRAVVLIGAAVRMPVNPDLLRQAKEDPAAAADLILKWGAPRDDVTSVTFLRGQMEPGALYSDLSACDGYAGAMLTPKPVLVMAGSADRLVKEADSDMLARALPQAQFVTVPGAGHMLMVEKPVETAQEIKAFIKGAPG